MKSLGKSAKISPEAREALDQLGKAGSAREFIDGVFGLMPKLLPLHLTAFGYRTIGYRPTTVIHSNGERFTAAGAPSLIVGNPAEDHVMKGPKRSVEKLSDFLPSGEELKRLPFYLEVMKPGGWRYGCGLAFWEPDPESRDLTAFVCALRTEEQGDFSASDIALCQKVHAEVERSLRRVIAREVVGEALRGLRSTLRKLPVPILVIGEADEVVAMSHAAEGILREWNGGQDPEIPPAVQRACAALRAGKSGGRTVKSGGGRTARVRWLEGQEGQWIRVEFRGIDRTGDRRKTLTEAERRLVGLLLRGLKDAEIAEVFGRRVSAVKAELRALYARHQVRSRAELLAAVL